MLERFTGQAREVIARAHDESRACNHSAIGCEHIVLALVHEEKGFLGRMFRSLDITVERVRAQVVRTFGPDAGASPGEIEFTQQAKKALELSLHESLTLGHSSVISFHILLGLLRVDEGLTTRTLSLLEVEADQLARAAKENCARIPSRTPVHLAKLARLQIEKQSATKARDFDRVADLDIRSRVVVAVMTEGNERRQDPMLARPSHSPRLTDQHRGRSQSHRAAGAEQYAAGPRGSVVAKGVVCLRGPGVRAG